MTCLERQHGVTPPRKPYVYLYVRSCCTGAKSYKKKCPAWLWPTLLQPSPSNGSVRDLGLRRLRCVRVSLPRVARPASRALLRRVKTRAPARAVHGPTTLRPDGADGATVARARHPSLCGAQPRAVAHRTDRTPRTAAAVPHSPGSHR
eukprot:1352748-Prymnesium_polylepis.1